MWSHHCNLEQIALAFFKVDKFCRVTTKELVGIICN